MVLTTNRTSLEAVLELFNSKNKEISVSREVVIHQEGGKGRAFRALLLASVEADLLWGGGSTSNNLRPVWAMFGGSDNELRAFVANLITGHKANIEKGGYSRKRDCVEILKTAGYQVFWQRELEGSLATVYLPDLFSLDPGMVDPDGIKFILLPSKTWYDAQQIDNLENIVQYAQRLQTRDDVDIRRLVPLAFLFAVFLDRRTRCPLIMDGRFYLQLLLATIEQGYTNFSSKWHSSYREDDIEDVGLVPGLSFQSTHKDFECLLAKEVADFFSKNG